jgi:DNA helicase HerA-like ATPase
MPETGRRDFFLYVDEAHLLATGAMGELFPEARKFHLGLILAHQYLDQLDEEVRAALLGNVGTLMVFRLRARDEEALAREFAPELIPTDLVSLPAHQVYLKLLVDGTTSRPFSALTLPAPPVMLPSQRERIIAESRRRYTRPIAVVEREVLRGWQPEPSGSQQRLDL